MKFVETVIYPALASFIFGLILYNVQVRFETTQKQIEYTEKIDLDLEKYLNKKSHYLRKKAEILNTLVSKYQEIQIKIINDNNNSNIILSQYIKEINNITYDLNFTKLSKELMNEEIKISYLKDKLNSDLLFLKIYSNNSLNGLENELNKTIQIMDKIHSRYSQDMQNIIYTSSNTLYLFHNTRTIQELKNQMEKTFNIQIPKLKKDIKDLEIKSQEHIEKLQKEKIFLLKEIHDKLNKNSIIVLFSDIIFKNKATIFN